jgi:glycosyltransferase involved in cell wall biosynthesis
MQEKTHIILIGNYPLDNQESMERFAQMLGSGFEEAGFPTEIWRPKALLGLFFKSASSGFGKWMGYVDKWLIFPLIIRWRLLNKRLINTNTRYHICDHSNSLYLRSLPSERTAITCHDVLAIRGALGYADAYCPASGFGKILQKVILMHLRQAKKIACVSKFTLRQLNELTPDKLENTQDWKVIYNAFNANFSKLDCAEVSYALRKVNFDVSVPFILHIGSNLPRKNRKALLDAVSVLEDSWLGNICYAGLALDDKLLAYASSLGLEKRVFSIPKPDHETLVGLYNACEAFIFPSFSEGFGWPVIEAQACGAPVIASNIEPMPEVSGGAAIFADPTSSRSFAKAILSLRNPDTRNKLISKGALNSKRFQLKDMIAAYCELHNLRS